MYCVYVEYVVILIVLYVHCMFLYILCMFVFQYGRTALAKYCDYESINQLISGLNS